MNPNPIKSISIATLITLSTITAQAITTEDNSISSTMSTKESLRTETKETTGTLKEVDSDKVSIQDTESLDNPIIKSLEDFDPDDVDTLIDMYRAGYGRAPDLPGLVHWLKTSSTVEEILYAFFVGQEEFKRMDALSIKEFIEATYENFLERKPDQEGAEYWENDLSSSLEEGINKKHLFVIGLVNGAQYDDIDHIEKKRKEAKVSLSMQELQFGEPDGPDGFGGPDGPGEPGGFDGPGGPGGFGGPGGPGGFNGPGGFGDGPGGFGDGPDGFGGLQI